MDNMIIYDGDCLFCSSYVKLVRLRESIGPIDLKNARENPELVRELTSSGYDLDEGMLLIFNGTYYYGDDCVNRLALLSTKSGLFNRLNKFIFKHPSLAKTLYPVLKLGRHLYFKLVGKEKILD